ncbi:alpha/beta hydrolase [candidate division KSB1 bacterium]|nr:alpha/beta hydrolase [candidate division KSB1 bacterium]
MLPVATELSRNYGVLEPFQTAHSISAQVEELHQVLLTNGQPPFVLIGFSWGAWLAVIFSAFFPDLTKKLILVGSGGFHEKYAKTVQQNRQSRLSERDQARLQKLMNAKDININELHRLLLKTDTYDPLPEQVQPVRFDWEIYHSVWPLAASWRKEGRLLETAAQIKCPVCAIHGDFDPHPAEGVKKPLTMAVSDFKFILLKHCGHKPWIEKHARDVFFKVLKNELQIERK